jgi:glutamate dehydrogenase
MSLQTEKYRQQILQKLAAYIKKQLPEEQAALIVKFAKQYYSMVSYEDMAGRAIEDLYGGMLSHWEFIYTRKPHECKVRVFNPEFGQHGWQSTHTVIEVAHEDMPFLVDSIRLEINRFGFLIHQIVHLGGLRIVRDKKHRVQEILPRNKQVPNSIMEAPLYLEIDRQTDPKVLKELKTSLEKVLNDVSIAVSDWSMMLDRLDKSLMELEQSPPPLDPAEVTESKALLRWLKDNFILFGARDYKLAADGDDQVFKAVKNSGLGVLRDTSKAHLKHLSDMPLEARKLALSSHILNIKKTNTRSTIHRSGYTDYLGVKCFNKKGEIVGESRFVGLYTSSAYNCSPKQIPFLRLKVAKVLQMSEFAPNSHAGKNLLNILETLPRDDLFQASADELLELTLGIFHLQERQRIRLFMRKDSYGRFYSCLVYVPRESFNTDLIQQFESILKDLLNADEVTYSTLFSESILARIHFMVRVEGGVDTNINVKEIEKKLIEVGTSWRYELHNALVDYYGEAQGVVLFNKYRHAFLASYREYFNPRVAAYDIEHLESLSDDRPLSMNFYRPLNRDDGVIRFKVYQRNHTIPLSDALPILENMGFRVIGERPHKIIYSNGSTAWINDFDLVLKEDQQVDIEEVKDNFQSAFAAIWLGYTENDGFNYLVIRALSTWRENNILRAYSRYFQQIGFPFSQAYITETLTNNPAITCLLLEIFHAKFEPSKKRIPVAELERLEKKIIKMLDEVASLDEDRILRQYLEAFKATVRTNYFQKTADDEFKGYLSFKLRPKLVPGMPKPYPKYEIFVYSVRFEGVHLRGAKVARGGLRWSDRREDYRTEILGLMKAQQVKNAVIVPLGAKGGFVAKMLPPHGSRDEIMQEGILCYQSFIKGLLDLTDNIVNQKTVPPENVICYDSEDPYLVVAADKGTATFSDIANEISQAYNFWLDDAFASGGSTGYDHKKMGITAKGAWESVKRHFREFNIDTQKMDFTVVGVGDMAGDVFGNGMLCSKHLKLVAAFNHVNIFIDPDPSAEESFKERKRLFNLSRSSWEDYNPKLISKGGGVFRRSAKAILVSHEMKELFGIRRDVITPNELISVILKSKVDLFWNGGIGTYVKASTETQAEVGDRSNDAVRVDANELQCRVVGEGGNLGLTQLARVEYALKGGMIYTDFIDNSAGVNCSDHEVNIKILLNDVVKSGDLTEKQRNKLLAEMTDEVSRLVLKDNYKQTQAISLTVRRTRENLDMYIKYIDDLEEKGKLDRELEYLPEEKVLLERKARDLGLTCPEIAVLVAYSKTLLKARILKSDVPEDPHLSNELIQEFPVPLHKKYREQMQEHSLRREIIATQLSNTIVNEMGPAFVDRMSDETGASVARIVRAFTIAQLVFKKDELWTEIEKLDMKVSVDTQAYMMRRLNRLIRRATRWFLRNRQEHLDIEVIANDFIEPVQQLQSKVLEWLPEEEKAKINDIAKKFVEKGVPKSLALRLALILLMFSVLDIVEATTSGHYKLEDVAKTYFAIGARLDLSWFREEISGLHAENHWHALARSFYRDDLDFLQRMLAISVLRQKIKATSLDAKIDHWFETNKYAIERWHSRVSALKASSSLDPVMFSVVLRDLLDLTRSNKRLIIIQ